MLCEQRAEMSSRRHRSLTGRMARPMLELRAFRSLPLPSKATRRKTAPCAPREPPLKNQAAAQLLNPPMNFKLLIQYDGTDFSGWQVQENSRTIQGELERVLEMLEGRHVNVN